MARLKTRKEFEEGFYRVHGDKYSLEKADYVNDSTKVCIVCPIHGEFSATPNNLLKGKGCPKCNHRSTAYTTEEWIEIMHEKYPLNDYSITDYVNNTTKIKFICPIHGVQEQQPKLHAKHGCELCRKEENRKRQTKTNEEFLKQAKALHNDKYLYLRPYVNAKTPIKVQCKDCGSIFEITPHSHLNKKRGCHVCKGGTKMSNEEFVRRVKDKHGDEFEILDNYVNILTPLRVRCNRCGTIDERPPRTLLDNCRCKTCSYSSLERLVADSLDKEGIDYVFQYRNTELLDKLTIDFYLPQYKIAIECQGVQHYESVKHFGGIKKLEQNIERDKRKFRICQENGIEMLYLTYYNKMEESETIFKSVDKLMEYIKNKGLKQAPIRKKNQ